jgi:hypothetical protein
MYAKDYKGMIMSMYDPFHDTKVFRFKWGKSETIEARENDEKSQLGLPNRSYFLKSTRRVILTIDSR